MRNRSHAQNSGFFGPFGAESIDLSRISSWISWNQINILVGTVVVNLIALVLPLVVLQTYDRILPNHSKASLGMLAALVALALVLEGVLRIARAHLVSWTGSSLVHALRCETVRRLVGIKGAEREQHEPGAHLERLSAIGTLKDHNTAQFVIAMVDLPFAFVFLALIAYIAWPLVFVPLLVFAVLAAIGLRLGQRLKSVAEDRSRAEERRHAFVVEVLSGVHTVKSLGMEELMNRRYERLIAAQAGMTHNALRLGARAHELGAAASQLTIVGVTAIGAVMIISGALTVGALVACSLLAGRALHPLLLGLGFWSQFQSLRVTAKRAAESVALLEDEPKIKVRACRLHGSLVARKVTFAYPQTAEPTFREFDLSIGSGELVVVTGESGAGKSTLLRLLASIHKPVSGEILYDGMPGTMLDPHSLGAQIGFIAQQSVLFRGTILENLTGFREGPTVEAALAIGSALGLDEKVALLPAGLDTKVGEIPSEALPPGTTQQIALVRAFATKPAIVLLDEAGSNFDSLDVARMCEFLKSLHRRTTIVFATQHPAIRQSADRHLHLANGVVTEIAAGTENGAATQSSTVEAGAP
jgi:ATP-binding cassette subfamily C protein LapB